MRADKCRSPIGLHRVVILRTCRSIFKRLPGSVIRLPNLEIKLQHASVDLGKLSASHKNVAVISCAIVMLNRATQWPPSVSPRGA